MVAFKLYLVIMPKQKKVGKKAEVPKRMYRRKLSAAQVHEQILEELDGEFSNSDSHNSNELKDGV